MNRKLLKRITAILVVLIVLYGCSSEDDHSEVENKVEPLTVATAQSLYEQYVGKASKLKSSSEDLSPEFFPDWSKGQLFSDSNWYVVESPLETSKDLRIRFMIPEVKEYCDANNIRPKQALRQVVMRNKQTGLDYAFMMVVMPDLDYMLLKGDELGENKYLTRESDLSGLVTFYTTDGEFVNGWIYKEGEIIAEIGDSEKNSEKKLKVNAAVVSSVVCWGQDFYAIDKNTGEANYRGVTYYCEPSCSYAYVEGGSPGLISPTVPPINTGGGGGGNGGGNGSGTAPKAKTIFRNSSMTEANWQKLEQMIEKIMQDCMGEALYNGLVNSLNGKTFTIQFVNSAGSFFNSSDYNGYSVGILLSTSMESNQLYHEMLHAYQAYQETETSYRNSIINIEIEAFYAQYLYLSKLPEYKGSKWEKWYDQNPLFKSIKKLEDHIDRKGNLMPGVSSSSLDLYILNGPVAQFQQDNSYKYEKYDYSRSGLDSFKNIRTLTKNCL
jgi:hypothetical protein